MHKRMFDKAAEMASFAEGGGKTGGLLSALKNLLPGGWLFKRLM